MIVQKQILFRTIIFLGGKSNGKFIRVGFTESSSPYGRL